MPPASLQQELYRLFGARMIYNHENNQVSCYAPITVATSQAITTLLTNHNPCSRRQSVGHFATCTYGDSVGPKLL